MTQPSRDAQSESSTQRGEPSPEAASPFVDADQADDEGRHVDRDVQDNADLDG